MELIVSVLEQRIELAAYTYFRVGLWIGKRSFEINFCRYRNGMFQFCVDLPLVHITNMVYRKTVTDTPPNNDVVVGYLPTCRSISQLSGNIFWYKIKI